jgi:hypothetical protein
VGVGGTVAGLTIIPALGVKAALTRFAAIKISGGVLGASANVALSPKPRERIQSNKLKNNLFDDDFLYDRMHYPVGKARQTIKFKRLSNAGVGAIIGGCTAGVAGIATSAIFVSIPVIAVGGVVGGVVTSIFDAVGDSIKK